jgi:hypothetical protein
MTTQKQNDADRDLLREAMIREDAKKAQGKNRRDASGSDGPYGILNYMRDVARSICEAVAPIGRVTWKIGKPVAKAAVSAGVFCGKHAPGFGKKYYELMATKKDPATGKRRFNARRLMVNLGLTAAAAYLAPFMLAASYYYMTFSTYENVYVPDAAVFINQQFVAPNKAGSLTAPRDEIYTVMGRHLAKDGQIEPLRLDIDSNYYFFWKEDALRPDLAAAKLNSQSPFGVKCTVQTTGIYNRLPRFLRLKAAQMIDLRPEIVGIVKVEEMTQMPPFVKIADDGVWPTAHGLTPLKPAMTPPVAQP